MTLRKTRIVSQVVFFALFVLFFFGFNVHPSAYTVQTEWFLRLNPLVAVVVSIATRMPVWVLYLLGGLVAVGTIVFGRFFCGMVCPLGAAIDFSDRYLFGASRSPSRRPPVFLQRIKYLLLFAVIVIAVFGFTWGLFFDPISIATRALALVVSPLARLVGSESFALARPVFGALGWTSLQLTSVPLRLFYGTGATVLLLAFVFLGGFWDRRFWCQYVCPSGAFMGLLAFRPVFRRESVQDHCNSCKSCARKCPTRAIDSDNVAITSTAECILCGICSGVRSVDCSHFGFVRKTTTDSAIVGPSLGRRHVVGGIAGGLAMVPVFGTDAMKVRDHTGRFIRPPGAVPEDEFGARCLGCGECIKACPTNTLQPGGFHDGFGRMYTPKVVPRIAGCEEKCAVCGYVCPTQAIRKLSRETKPFVKIGTAVIDRHRCLAWSQNKECLVCDEVCPYNAIVPKVVETTKGLFRVPVVYEDLCMGCGMCEQHCPVTDTAAIVVYRFGENRRSKGEYVSPWQKKEILRKRAESDRAIGSSFIQEDTSQTQAPALDQTPHRDRDTEEKGSGADGSSLPPGFLVE